MDTIIQKDKWEMIASIKEIEGDRGIYRGIEGDTGGEREIQGARGRYRGIEGDTGG